MKLNAGIPILRGNQTVYEAEPKDMALYARQMHELGVKIIGACCGSTPAHIEAMANELQRLPV